MSPKPFVVKPADRKTALDVMGMGITVLVSGAGPLDFPDSDTRRPWRERASLASRQRQHWPFEQRHQLPEIAF